MADMTASSMATYLPEVWSAVATITDRMESIIWPKMDHTWEPEIGVGKGDTVNIPNFTQNVRTDVTVRSTFGTGATLTWVANQESQTQLNVNKMAYQAHRMPVEMSAQHMPVYQALLAQGIGMAVAQQRDFFVADDSTDGFNSFTAIGTDNVDVTEAIILAGETNLNANNAKTARRMMFASPATRASMLQIDVLRNQLFATANGNLDGKKGNGFIGSIYTLDVFMYSDLSAGTSGKKNWIGQMEAIAVAAQVETRMVGGLNIADGLFNEVVGYNVYGVKKVKSTHGREVAGK